jgi:hypothetical protein
LLLSPSSLHVKKSACSLQLAHKSVSYHLTSLQHKLTSTSIFYSPDLIGADQKGYGNELAIAEDESARAYPYILLFNN